MLRQRAPIIVGLALSVALTIPFAVRQNSWFEWANPYWLLLLQRDEIAATGHPSYFIHSAETGLFYPVNLFYAGFTVSLLAGIALLVPPWLVFSASIFGAFFAAFVGVLWVARALGVSTAIATAAAAIYTASPQYVAKLYTRGAWAEFVAIALVTLVLGAALRAMTDERDGRPTTWSIIVVAGGTCLLAGTHNLTVALAAPFVAVLMAAHAWTLHRRLRPTARSLATPALAAAVGMALAGAFTVPNLWLAGASQITEWDFFDAVPEWNTPAAVLGPHATGSVARVNETTSLLLVPIAVLLFVSWRRRRDERRSLNVLALAAAAVVVILVVLTTAGALWSDPSSVLHRLVPEKALRTIQFPARLTAFLTIALLVLLLALAGGFRRRLTRVGQATIALCACWYIVTGVAFAFATDRSSADFSPTTTRQSISVHEFPPAFASGQRTQFLLTARGDPLDTPSQTLSFDVDSHQVDSAQTVRGVPVLTNVVWSPLVRFGGADLMGRDASGMAVIVVPAHTDGEVTVVAAHPWPVWLGRIASLVGLLVGVWFVTGRVRQRARRTPAVHGSTASVEPCPLPDRVRSVPLPCSTPVRSGRPSATSSSSSPVVQHAEPVES